MNPFEFWLWLQCWGQSIIAVEIFYKILFRYPTSIQNNFVKHSTSSHRVSLYLVCCFFISIMFLAFKCGGKINSNPYQILKWFLHSNRWSWFFQLLRPSFSEGYVISHCHFCSCNWIEIDLNSTAKQLSKVYSLVKMYPNRTGERKKKEINRE